MKVIENAKEIWMEGSSITWICEKLKLKAEKLVLYQRNGSFNSEMHNLFSHPWSEHGSDVNSLVNIPLRNKIENQNPEDVLNGNIDQFIEEGIKNR